LIVPAEGGDDHGYTHYTRMSIMPVLGGVAVGIASMSDMTF
jgi:hypothetical protein